ncbi:hypothetical protein FO519_007353 [Halicephalobus sp. NKZ332]|nr:hypothetical protein FO519_007353 [Halicephalobus sp. NKZ332]
MPDIFELSRQKLHEKDANRHPGLKDDEGESSTGTEQNESTIVICGNQHCGKTTLIYRFLEKPVENSRTIGLEYNFLIRMQNNNKAVCSIWEVGGGAKMAPLVRIPLTAKSIDSSAICIFVDLSSPSDISEALLQTISVVEEQIEVVMKEVNQVDHERHDRILAKTKNFTNHKDAHVISPSIIPITIIAAHYDQFQNYETERKKTLYKFLRFFAHIHGATILTFIPSAEGVVSKCKALLSHYGFRDGRPSLQQNTDVMKPLVVPAGSDSLEAIGTMSGVVNPPSTHKEALRQWKEAIEEHFPQEDKSKKKSVNVTTDKQFAEYEIDATVEQRKRELELFIREKKNRRALDEKNS